MQYQVRTYQPATTTVVERKRTPLGKLGAWVSNKVAGTLLQSIVSAIFFGPFYFRLLTFIAVSIALGSLTDLTIQYTPATLHVSTYVSSEVVVAAIAGAGAGGFSGAIVGGLWGWFVQQIGDTVASELVNEPATERFGAFIGWAIAASVGWIGGVTAARAFEAASSRSTRVGNFLKQLVKFIVIVSYLIFVYQLIIFFRILSVVNGWSIPSFPVIAPFIVWTLIVLCWLATLIALFGVILAWYAPSFDGKNQPRGGQFIYSTGFSLWCIWVYILLVLMVLYSNPSQVWYSIGLFFVFWQFFEAGFIAIFQKFERRRPTSKAPGSTSAFDAAELARLQQLLDEMARRPAQAANPASPKPQAPPASPAPTTAAPAKQSMTTADVARALKLPETTVQELARKGELPGVKVRGRWRFDPDEIQRLRK